MSQRTFATIAAVTSLITGAAGLVAPQLMATVFGVSLDPVGIDLVRLACASYLGYAALNWMARGVTDASAWRAIAAGNAVGWAAGCIATIVGILSGFDGRVWLVVAIEVCFTAAWSLTAVQTGRLVQRTSRSAA